MFYCGCCLVVADCGGAKSVAGLMAADVLAMRWWLEERQLILV